MNHHLIVQGNALRLPLADQSVHCCVTSPPYFGLRDYGVPGQIGLEPTPEAFTRAIVAVFREVWRVLRNDGTCWMNIGDSYATGGRGGGAEGSRQTTNKGSLLGAKTIPPPGLKPKDLIGIPWRVAFALQAEGWYLRSDVIWHKPNPMTESVRDRPAKSHEYLFLLSKQPRYFYDAEAVKERDGGKRAGNVNGFKDRQGAASFHARSGGIGSDGWEPGSGRNKRSVWTVATKPYKGAHFATFPPKLITPCIRAGTSEKGCCPLCGAPWRRIVQKTRQATRPGLDTKVTKSESVDGRVLAGRLDANVIGNRDPERHVTVTTTIGWESSCGHLEARAPVPCVVFDPFGGACTTALVAASLGRDSVCVELSRDYCLQGKERLTLALALESARRRARPKRAAKVRMDPAGQKLLF